MILVLAPYVLWWFIMKTAKQKKGKKNMLQIQHIRKEYKTGKLVQKALDDVSLNLRDNEFVAILGPSGSGKTTLLNIIGGLDRYDSGDLIINGISTKKYKDRDWDSYRNHTIGFVFQSYNLIPHQTLLANVELALTISGVGKAERRRRAKEALEKVGLGEQIEKRPGQLSGGQMQRVAIARALVNDPEILLADEPTGALDSNTSVQVMDLLREVAKDRLVVMVTHNPELAELYATRIVNLRDGKIRSDTNPYQVDEAALSPPEHKNMGKSSMSFLTALALSFNNLKTKKARTLLTSFAGSIGIIGIALILALSNGVNAYIQSVEEETLSEYPLEIQRTGFDLTSMMTMNMGTDDKDAEKEDDDQVNVVQMITNMFSTMDSNDLKSLKKYLDDHERKVSKYAKSVEYSYSATPQIFRLDKDRDKIRQVNPDKSFASLGLGSSSSANSMMSSMMSTDVFYEMPREENLYKNQYDVKAGRWPESYDECVVVMTADGSISDFLLYTLGLRDAMELDDMIEQFMKDEDVDTPDNIGTYRYEDILGTTFKLVNASDYYSYDSEYKVWKDKSDNNKYMKKLVKNGEDLKVVGIVQPSEDANGALLRTGIYYPAELTDHVIEEAKNSKIVKAQMKNEDIDVFTNEEFGKESNNDFDMGSLFKIDEDKLQHAFKFDENAMANAMAGSTDLSDAFSVDPNTLDLSGMLDLSAINISLPEAPDLSLGNLMSGIKIQASSEDVSKLTTTLLTGYRDYAKEHPEADYSGLGENFIGYLNTEKAQEILKNNIKDIIEASGSVEVSKEELQQLIKDIMTGFQKYAQEKGYTDMTKLDEYLTEYLQTEECQQILTAWAEKNIHINGDVNITKEQLEKLSKELLEGYESYVQENGYPDPAKMGEYFMDYLGTDSAKQELSAGLMKMIDTKGVEEQISAAIGTYMQSAFSSYGNTLSQALGTQISKAMGQMMTQIAGGMEKAMTQAMSRVGENLQNAFSIDADAFTGAFDISMDGEELTELMMSMGNTGSTTYDSNLQKLGYADKAEPSGISIYPKNFESKEQIVHLLDDYNSKMEREGKDEQVISYTDMVGTLMSSVTDIVDIISYVLIAFVAISLVVSSIMIGVITYISVLERRKEIGILRAIGASKGNISQVFNAETCIIGLCAGLIGIGLTLLLLIPGNALIHKLADTTAVSASLPVIPALILIVLSVFLTFIGGLIPSKKAAKSDPVTALRND